MWLLACGFVVASGGSAVFVDQPVVQYGFSADSLDIEVDCRDAGNLAVTVRNPLGHALMWAGSVAVDLVLDQDGVGPRPRKPRPARTRNAAPRVRLLWTITGPSTFGRTCLNTIAGLEIPDTRAASM
jgi:hypothetical protein